MDYDELSNRGNTNIAPVPPSNLIEVHVIIFTIFQLIAIITNAFIIFTMLYFKRLRTAPYLYIASWAISDLLSLVFLPSGLRLFSFLEHVAFPSEIYCIFYQSGSILHSATIQFVTLVAIDWVIAAYFTRASQRFRKWYTLVLGIVWTLVVIMATFAVSLCWNSYMHFLLPIICLILSLGIAYLTVIIIEITRLVQKLRKKPSECPTLGINLATAFLGCWAFSVLYVIFILNFYIGPFTLTLVLCLIYSSPIVNFILLYFFSNEFSACVRQLLSCRRIKYEEDLTVNLSVQGNLNTSRVNISFGDSTVPSNLQSMQST